MVHFYWLPSFLSIICSVRRLRNILKKVSIQSKIDWSRKTNVGHRKTTSAAEDVKKTNKKFAVSKWSIKFVWTVKYKSPYIFCKLSLFLRFSVHFCADKDTYKLTNQCILTKASQQCQRHTAHFLPFHFLSIVHECSVATQC